MKLSEAELNLLSEGIKASKKKGNIGKGGVLLRRKTSRWEPNEIQSCLPPTSNISSTV